MRHRVSQNTWYLWERPANKLQNDVFTSGENYVVCAARQVYTMIIMTLPENRLLTRPAGDE